MKRQEFIQQYELHNVAPPHDRETCEICQKYEHMDDNPQRDVNGNY